MGELYTFICDNCRAEEEIEFGAGFIGCLTPHHCAVCGRIDHTHEGFNPEGSDDDFRLRHTAACKTHPGSEMIEVTPEMAIPCPKCGSGLRRRNSDDPVTIWD